MQRTLRSAAFTILALGLALVASSLVMNVHAYQAQPSAPAPAATYTLSLYGSATRGWGLTPTAITNPGPSLTLFVGDTVTLHLFSNDSVTHTWYIDLTKDNANDTGDISAGSFSSNTTAHTFTFTVPNSPGTYTYYCEIHPSSMRGTVTIVSAATYVLYGSLSGGWGSTSSGLTNPGPTLSAHQGDVVTFELISQDGAQHSFFIDIDHSGAIADASDPKSPDFGGSSPPVASWSYTVAAAPGNYTYYCGVHGAAMEGTFRVLATQAPPPSGGPDYTLYAAAIVIIAVIAIAAMVVIRRRPRIPPTPPPQ